jgi:hypothetical protein
MNGPPPPLSLSLSRQGPCIAGQPSPLPPVLYRDRNYVSSTYLGEMRVWGQHAQELHRARNTV